ncbi:NADP-dependent oxidoreductase [Halolamina salifodinae]|uniref:NADPH-dependent curcumin reductase CurA n=1 Tax=Halolamina salifodinae TaxID=1202767 RepID=A0A8T4GZ98_9EURY|nr:NADP-dependent oxidoreductase [Halolamina salifodinae]MBP1986438.1 NADPH-dependent curcumin reductase CurA [Halolamina salifodinae]
MVSTNRYYLADRPDGVPDDDTFDLRTVELGDPGPGEVLVKIRYLSVDPYMRGRMDAGESYAEPWEVDEPLQGGGVGEVVNETGTEFEAGDTVVGNMSWSEYHLADADGLQRIETGALPVSTALGVLGMPGRTAYFGTREVLEPRAGDTVVVSAAAGAVGSVVGQLAKLQGARVVGFAGSDEKCEVVEEEFGFDACINYKTTDDYVEALAEAAPEGVDGYFDNVGGPITDAVFAHLNVDARVAVCGQIALYNAEETPTGPRKLGKLIETRARVQGLLVGDFAPRFEQATADLAEWVAAGDIEYRESVVEGIENAPDAFLGLFEGENIGKQVVKVE